VHKTLLNSVLLSPIVCGGVRPKLPGQTPLGHNPLCFLPFVVRLGSGPRLVGRIGTGVRVSVSFRQKYPAGICLTMSYGSRKRSYDQGVVCGGWFPSPAYNVERVTNNIIRSRLVRTATDAAVSARLDAFRCSSQLYFSHFATRTTCMQCTIWYDTIVCI